MEHTGMTERKSMQDDDVSLDGFDDAPVTERKPNSIEQIERCKKLIESLQMEIRKLEKKVPLDSIPALKAALVKRFGRAPVKGDFIMANKANGFYYGPLMQVYNPKVDLHDDEPYIEPEDDEDFDEDDRYWGMAAHIKVIPFNALIKPMYKKEHLNDFGLDDMQSKKKEFRLLTQAEVDVLPRVITGTWSTGPHSYSVTDPKTGNTLQSNTKTTIKVYATSTAEAEAAYASVVNEIKKELKKAPKWKGKRVLSKSEAEREIVTRLYCYKKDDVQLAVGEAYRSTYDMGSVKIEFFLGKKIPKGGRKVTKVACY